MTTVIAMPVLSHPLVTRVAAALIQGVTSLAPRLNRRHRFPDIACATRRIEIPTAHGVVPATLYLPASGDVPPPLHINLHGGGFIIRYPEQDDPLCRYLAARRAGVAVLNVDYPVAPQHPFPIPPKACFEVTRWAAEHAGELGVDPERLSIGGASAGGSLATAVARQARDAGGPHLALQVLHYPSLDLVTSTQAKLSARGRTEPPFLKPWMSAVFHNSYLPDKALGLDPLASPAYGDNGADLAGTAPALLITTELDLLNAEGRRYAEALRRAGVLLEHRDIPGVDHGYDQLGAGDDLARETYDLIVEHLRRVTSSARTGGGATRGTPGGGVPAASGARSRASR
ncbi:alpha/beta hydrolase [Saccharopolyspora endophytica]|uniref:Alpha/beta hydrolase n=1 Tax=Saccharopolyspora endophytica TaxID=543886 RepID=A0ABS5DC85_9PSEU|nr:alpha/beta hydrolase [Saccharopolyspora endophytica]MBQ0923893.1 alpha/beta hydrolase [Saccharopolyspora endophytica]